jgi:CRISPR-associated protein Cas1
MRQHLNTLYVTTQGAYLSVERESVIIKHEKEVKLRVPLHMLESIVSFGNVAMSPFLMGRCGSRGIGVAFLTERGRFLGRIQGSTSGNIMLRRQQYRQTDHEDHIAQIARIIVAAKIVNSRTVLQRAVRDYPNLEGGDVPRAIRRLQKRINDVRKADLIDAIRGIEGDAARTYFSVFNHLVVSNDKGFSFNGRTRRPPGDPVNAMLSFVYTLLTADVASALEAVGLDPQAGFLHRDRPGRSGLALDLVEELRAFVGDRLVLSLINRGQVQSRGFETRESGAVWMSDETRKILLATYQQRKNDELIHPFLGEKTTVGMIVHLQARLMARHLRGDLDTYPPFVWR